MPQVTARPSAASTAGQPPMRTVLSELSDAFEEVFAPLLEPVEQAAEALGAAPGDVSARHVLPALRDLRHQMQALTDKVTEQQAYVLIFGPLKSGKSTFMNALSAAYVSEVTSLPAYPCMVYVTHSDVPGFVVTHYDGRTTTYTDSDALSDLVESDHHELSKRIREIEAAGDIFDPATHMPDAVRRIDVRIPIQDLAQSGAALVDTPGLYTRMKFGYEQMTRDFRNAAACAIFIVKTDNLFLEQVFDEFGELLELFSRIFLVVNVDSTKMDLQPDGTLAPSLEQTAPGQVVQAFEDLSMTGPLKKAFEEGRLEIYPVDLLRAASRRMLARRGSGETPPGPNEGQAEFDDVLEDLSQFLNSNEYLKAFVDDSLRRARSLVDELGSTCADDSVTSLARDVESLDDRLRQARAEAVVLDRLRQVKWHGNTEQLAPRLAERVRGDLERIEAEAAEAVLANIGRWFEGSQSLHDLIETELRPTFEATHSRLIESIRVALERCTAEDLTSIAGDLDTLTDLETVEIDIRAKIAGVLEGFGAQAQPSAPRPHLSSNEIPVRRSFPDWVLLRSGTAVRARLFGSAAHRDAEIPPALKARRLGEPAREAICASITSQLASALEGTANELPAALMSSLAETLEHDLASELEQSHSKVKERLRDTDRRLREVNQAHEGLAALSGNIDSFRASIDELIARFGQFEHVTLADTAN